MPSITWAAIEVKPVEEVVDDRANVTALRECELARKDHEQEALCIPGAVIESLEALV